MAAGTDGYSMDGLVNRLLVRSRDGDWSRRNDHPFSPQTGECRQFAFAFASMPGNPVHHSSVRLRTLETQSRVRGSDAGGSGSGDTPAPKPARHMSRLARWFQIHVYRAEGYPDPEATVDWNAETKEWLQQRKERADIADALDRSR